MCLLCRYCYITVDNICSVSRLPAAVQPPDPADHLQTAAGVQRLPGAEVPRPAAAAPAQDSAQAAAAPAHLRPGPGEL